MDHALAVTLLLAASLARAQDSGLGVADGRGGLYSVTNRSGRTSYFQITKLTMGGGILWNLPYDPGEDVHASMVVVDPDGNLYVGGTLRTNNRTYTMLAKCTASGGFSWRQIHDAGGDSSPTSMAVDPKGFVFIASTVYEPSSTFIRVLRYSQTGNYYWGSNYKAGRSAYSRNMMVDPNGCARVNAEVSFGDLSSGIEVRQVLFTPDGAVVPQ